MCERTGILMKYRLVQQTQFFLHEQIVNWKGTKPGGAEQPSGIGAVFTSTILEYSVKFIFHGFIPFPKGIQEKTWERKVKVTNANSLI